MSKNDLLIFMNLNIVICFIMLLQNAPLTKYSIVLTPKKIPAYQKSPDTKQALIACLYLPLICLIFILTLLNITFDPSEQIVGLWNNVMVIFGHTVQRKLFTESQNCV